MSRFGTVRDTLPAKIKTEWDEPFLV